MKLQLSSSLNRIGFGSMQLTGPGHWAAPFTAEKYIRKALYPYPDGLVIATKGGFTRQGPDRWAPCGRPEYLRQCVEMSLRRLQVERMSGITFVPYAPFTSGALTTPGVLGQIAEDYGVTPAQLALAWLLHQSPAITPIPGTKSSTHLYENLAAQEVNLTREAMVAIELAVTKAHSPEELRTQKPGGGDDEASALL